MRLDLLVRNAHIRTLDPERPTARTLGVLHGTVVGLDEDVEQLSARRVLDADHHGLEKVKKRILEYLAVRKLNPEGKGPILCFVGPPGVGKTSLGQSIARATGREFVRVSLGGVHDEAEIRGHRRTYIGALPGNVIQNMRKAGTRRCLMMLDEVDKLGAGGFHGDPASALLEVLDPEQNATFRDNYLGVPYDLSAVMFICTANVLDTIQPALRDRMEVIRLAGYTEEEKREIAIRHLIPKQMEENGITAKDLHVSKTALTTIIQQYTQEAGLRQLEIILAVAGRVARARDLAAESAHALAGVTGGPIDVLVAEHDDEVTIAMPGAPVNIEPSAKAPAGDLDDVD